MADAAAAPVVPAAAAAAAGPAMIPDDDGGGAAAAMLGASSSLATAPTTKPTHLAIESADILRLIMAHLTECGLHDSCRALRQESGVGAAGINHGTTGLLRAWTRDGRWGDVLECLGGLDAERSGLGLAVELIADVHEMSILELADGGDIELAFAALRLCSDDLDEVPISSNGVDSSGLGMQERRTASIERRINALASLRSLHGTAPASISAASGAGGTSSSGSSGLIPPDYYGPSNITRQKRRDEIGRALVDAVPVVPPSRLTSLLQQAVKWQGHTGQLPQVRELWDDDISSNNDNDVDDKDDDEGSRKKKKRKKSSSSRKRRKKFDIVLGEVDIVSALEGGDGPASGRGGGGGGRSSNAAGAERIVKSPYSTIKFGKKSYVECATFLPDGSGLVTGSSDGFIEIWDPDTRYTDLRQDLPYQKADEILLHDAAVLALAVSNDGTMLSTGSADGMIKVWKVDDGKCLRLFENAHRGAVSCLAFSSDASHVLSGSHDSTLREFGLRASRMLKEFRGHGSYVNSCAYVATEGRGTSSTLLVVSGSADGTVRVWDGRSAECMHVLTPTTATVTVGMSLAATSAADETVAGRSVHTVIPVHTPANCMIIVPRCPRAFLVSRSGVVLRVFERDDTKGRSNADDKADFVAATVSPSNKWVYVSTEDGLLLCYDVSTGRIERTIRDFAVESSGSDTAEISGLVHHVHKSLLGGYSNDKGLKRGRLTMWK